MPTKNLAVTFTDIKGFTARTSASTRDGMKVLLAEHDRLLVPVIRYFDGTIVKTIGDAFLVYFESPTDSVLCGVAIQEVLRQYNLFAEADEKIEVRVAINVGEVELKGGDILGEAVNIAARLEAITEAGEVYFTDSVYQTMNRREAPSADIGEKLFKGIPHPIRVYRVINDPASDLSKRLAENVHLSDKGPVLKGIREKAEQRQKYQASFFISLAAIFFLLVIAIFFLLPSASQKASKAAGDLMAAGNHLGALTVLNEVLVDEPTNEALRKLAMAAAESHLEQLMERREYREAREWLDDTLKKNPSLMPLRMHEMALDARVAVDTVLKDKEYQGQYYPIPIKEFLAHYPDDATAPYEVAMLLEGKWYAISRIWLFHKALDRGLAPNDLIFRFCVDALTKGRPDFEKFRKARGLLSKYYREKAFEWARQTLVGTNVMAFKNAWDVLSGAGERTLDDPYFKALKKLIGIRETDELEQIFKVFIDQQQPDRQRQIIGFLSNLVETFPTFISSRSIRDVISTKVTRLRSDWEMN